MAQRKYEVYQPIPEDWKVYEQLSEEYLQLHDYFCRGDNNVMKTLKQIKAEANNAG